MTPPSTVLDVYLDHDVSIHVAPLLRDAGLIVATARDFGAERASDAEHLWHATEISQAPIVTHNGRHFWLLHEAWQFWSQWWGVGRPHLEFLCCPMPQRISRRTAYWSSARSASPPSITSIATVGRGGGSGATEGCVHTRRLGRRAPLQ